MEESDRINSADIEDGVIDGPVNKSEEFDTKLKRRRTRDFVARHRIPAYIAHLPIYSWQWSLMPMTTLGLSTLLHAQISLHNFQGLYTIGLVIYFIGLVQYFAILFGKTLKFVMIQHSFRDSFLESEEALLSAAFWISTYGLITGAIDFSQPQPGSPLSTAYVAFFWFYAACALINSVGSYIIVFSEGQLKSAEATPLWLLPLLPVILVGVMAGSLVGVVDEPDLYCILLGGLTCAGLGFFLSIPISAIYLHRLLVAGLPVADTRPGMMVAVGPPTYFPLGLLKMAAGIPSAYGYFAMNPIAKPALETMAVFMAIGIFGAGLAFFALALAPILAVVRRIRFHLTWYSFVFPNVGLLSSMGLLGLLIPSKAITWVATVGTVVLCAVWLTVSAFHIHAIVTKSRYLF